MAESVKITHADMRNFIKYINFISQNIILHEEEYGLNLQLDCYNPFAKEDQPARARVADITHAMGITVIQSSRRRAVNNKPVDSSAEEIYFLHVKEIPEWIEAQMNSVDQERLPAILHQVMRDHVQNAANRSAALELLKPYLAQERLECGLDEALQTFVCLKDRLSTIIEVLGALTAVHDVIGMWAEETNRIGLLYENTLPRAKFEEEMERIGEIFINTTVLPLV